MPLPQTTNPTKTDVVKTIEPGTMIDGRMLGRTVGLTAPEGTQIVKDKETDRLFLQVPLTTAERDEESGSIRRLAAPTGIAAVDAASAVYISLYQEILGGTAGGVTTELVQDVPMDGKSLVSPMFSGMPRIRKWTGARQFKSPRAFVQSANLDRYEVSTAIKRIEVDYDKSGAYSKWLEAFLKGQLRAVDDLVIALFLANTWTTPDATAALSTTHPFTNSTGNNLTTNPISYTAYDSMRQALELWQDEFGTPANNDFSDCVLLGGPKSRRTIMEITGAPTRTQGISNAGALDATSNVVGAAPLQNVYANDAKPMIVNWIGGRQWLFVTRANGQRPFIMGVGRALEPIIQIAMDAENRYMLDEYRFGMDGDLAFMPAPPFLYGGSVTA